MIYLTRFYNSTTVSASRENPAENSSISVQFVAHIYNDAVFIGQNFWLGAAFEMGTTQIWAGQIQVNPSSAADNTGMVRVKLYAYKYLIELHIR